MCISIRRYLLVLSFVNVLRVCYSAMEGFIVGGEHSEINEFPHSAYVSVSCQMVGQVQNWGCGSSILNQRILMTAAHCLENCLPSSIVGISVGSEHKGKGTVASAKSFVLHPKYSEDTVQNDIALICLKKSLKMNKNVQRVALMKKPPYYEPAVIAGWGLVDEKKNLGTKTLKFAKQTVWPYKKCVKLLKSMHDGTICANNGYTNRDKVLYGYAAEGDSGSALIVRGYIAIGVVSFKQPSISPSVVVYTDTAYYLEWIKKTSRKLFCKEKKKKKIKIKSK